MKRTLLLLLLLLCATTVTAQDVLTVGSVTVTTGAATASVPVSILDVSGTHLDGTAAASIRPQALVMRFEVTPGSAVTAVSFTRGGVLQTLTPLYERGLPGQRSAAYFVSFLPTDALPIPVNGTGSGSPVGTLEVTLVPGLRAGTQITITADPKTTLLSNSAGTLTESQYNGHLRLVAGTITLFEPGPKRRAAKH